MYKVTCTYKIKRILKIIIFCRKNSIFLGEKTDVLTMGFSQGTDLVREAYHCNMYVHIFLNDQSLWYKLFSARQEPGGIVK